MHLVLKCPPWKDFYDFGIIIKGIWDTFVVKYFYEYGDTKLSEFGRTLMIFANFFSGIWDTFQII